MLKKIIFATAMFISVVSWSQTKPLPFDPTKMSIEDMQKLAAMKPEEKEAYRKQMLKNAEEQLRVKARAANITIDETLLPSTQLVLPVKDIKRLSAIPVNPPSRAELLQQTSKMENALRNSVGKQVVQKVEEFAASKSLKEIQAATIGGWYDNKPESSLLLGMKAIKKDPENILSWNNLAALLNMSGLEQQAIPILQNLLIEKPDNSMFLNNMGQSYLGLGDITKAKDYFSKCLSIDELHPEANHSMALIYLFQNDADNALRHLEKELQIAQRRSSLAQLVKSGYRNRINIARLRKQKMQMDGTDNRNFFEEINLGKFKIPDPPENSKSSIAWRNEHAGLMQSIVEEVMFWTSISQATSEEIRAEGKTNYSVYHDMVNELIKDLGDQYIPLLAIIDEDDVPFLTQLQVDHAKRDSELKCPEPPSSPGNAAVLFPAYEKQCCDLKTPLIDDLMYKHNSFVSARINEAQSNYRQYINGLISIIQLDPSPGNKRMVYAVVANYFTFMANAINAYLVLDPYMTCKDGLTSEEAKDIITSARTINIKCPSWMKMNASLGVAKLKADCTGFTIEADVYKLIHVGAEKKFATGTSTLYVGAGIEGNFKGVAKGSLKQQFYVTFDHNNEFADLGIRGSATGDLAGGALGADYSYDFAMNSGFNAQGKIRSDWVTNYEKALALVGR